MAGAIGLREQGMEYVHPVDSYAFFLFVSAYKRSKWVVDWPISCKVPMESHEKPKLYVLLDRLVGLKRSSGSLLTQE